MLKKDRKIYIVTGGCGFIGSHLVEALLEKGHCVRVLDNLSTGRVENLSLVQNHPNLKISISDITDRNQIESAFGGVHGVFHVAALADIVPSIEQPDRYFNTNVTGTLNILEASRKFGIQKLIYVASSSCYGIPDHYPTTETAAMKPQYPYALTKMLGEELVFHWGQIYGLNVLSLRFFNVYGPRARTTGQYGAVFGVFLGQKLAEQPLTVVGDGSQTRDFTYVSDVVSALMMAVESSNSQEVFNVGSGQTYSVNELVRLLNHPFVNIPKRPGEPDCTWADITKIKKYLGWEPKVSLSDGVNRMLRHIHLWPESMKDAPVWTPDKIEKATSTWFKYLGKGGHVS